MTQDADTERILYEFNLTCGHTAEVEVDAYTREPENGIYVCPECGAEERVPLG